MSRPTFVVAAVCLRDDAGRLLTVRKRGTRSFMLPGGKIEPGETPAEAGLREVREEVGVDLAGVVLLGHFLADAANEPGHLVDSTVFTADLPGVPAAAGEIAELRWVDPADPGDVGDVRLAPLLRDHVLPALGVGSARG
ncbi:NUDIX domain-containing protein [Nocardioides dongxiaopingii]|uniref:NUDIX hydrolase n=1 Tax=Nocardioides sp. S-1144 TaxID=2582905 RepID=UPI00110E7350|nr:NUDIX domain-containing protein [Nocardioides sp. S-1144]QCW51162.1 NUDIX domain-containing protein [Nocardioides sp. S-1144]